MFESNKGMVLRECDRLNETRGVMTGSVSHTTFFHRIQGDLLISGYLASNLSLITDLVLEYLCRKDMPTILLSCHPELFGRIRGMCAGAEEQIAISDSLERKYQPFYGLGKEKLLHFIHRAAELLGYHTMLFSPSVSAYPAIRSSSSRSSADSAGASVRSSVLYLTLWQILTPIPNTIFRAEHRWASHCRRSIRHPQNRP